MAERPTQVTRGILAGHLADRLWDLLQELGVTARPVYQDTLKELSLMAQRLREAEEELAKYRVEDEGSSVTGPPPKKLKIQPSTSSSTSP